MTTYSALKIRALLAPWPMIGSHRYFLCPHNVGPNGNAIRYSAPVPRAKLHIFASFRRAHKLGQRVALAGTGSEFISHGDYTSDCDRERLAYQP